MSFEKLKLVVDPSGQSTSNDAVYEKKDPVKGDYFVLPKSTFISTVDAFWELLEMYRAPTGLNDIKITFHNSTKFNPDTPTSDWIPIVHPEPVDTDNVDKILDIVLAIEFFVDTQYLINRPKESSDFVVTCPITFSF